MVSCHLRPDLGSYQSQRFGPLSPNTISVIVSPQAIIDRVDELVEMVRTRPKLRYLVVEYLGPASEPYQRLCRKAIAVVESSRVVESSGGRLVPVLSFRDPSWATSSTPLLPSVPSGWILATHVFESSVVNPGWAGPDSQRSVPVLGPTTRAYVVMWGYLGEGIGAYPKWWLEKFVASLKTSGVLSLVADWRVSSTTTCPLPPINLGVDLTRWSLVIQPVAPGETIPQSWVDAELLDRLVSDGASPPKEAQEQQEEGSR